MQDRIKVDGRAGQLGDKIKLSRESAPCPATLHDSMLSERSRACRHRQVGHFIQRAHLQEVPQVLDQKVLEEKSAFLLLCSCVYAHAVLQTPCASGYVLSLLTRTPTK